MVNPQFNFMGILLLVIVFLTFAAGKASKMIATFLGVFLLSMVLLNWAQIRPLILKEA